MEISRLSSEVVNQIAAGEVLERPANLVKELIENSLDAGATRIEVECAEGGRFVRVSDNGAGIPSVELKLAVEPHSTSKIHLSEDIYKLMTYGFRGEALASAASVGDFEIVSRVQKTSTGSRLNVKFGRIGEVDSISSPIGTTITVRDLFENVPARLKFLKSASAEVAQIRQVIKALALVREDVEFLLRESEELTTHFSPTGDLKARAQEVLGVEELFLNEEADVQVVFSPPNRTQRVNRGIWLFVNGRWIQDRSLTAAVMDGYRSLLMHGEYPYVVVRLKLEPSLVDVNVHPTKSQVKFQAQQDVFRVVRNALREGLEKTPWLKEQKDSSTPNDAGVSLGFSEPSFFQTQLKTHKPFSSGRKDESAANARVVNESVKFGTVPSEKGESTSERVNESFSWARLAVLGQLHQTYILAQSDTHFYMVDQHAAHERVVFERLRARVQDDQLEVQRLLVPLALDLTIEELERLERSRSIWGKLGVEFEKLGPQTLAVNAMPALVTEAGMVAAMKVGADMDQVTPVETQALDVLDHRLATMACHSVVRAGQTLSFEQMSELLSQMDEFPLSSFCPHGRPVYVRRSFFEIEREFGRRL